MPVEFLGGRIVDGNGVETFRTYPHFISRERKNIGNEIVFQRGSVAGQVAKNFTNISIVPVKSGHPAKPDKAGIVSIDGIHLVMG
jgi:hypothetical protein